MLRYVGLPIRRTRIVAPEALLAIHDAPSACIAHWARQTPVPNPLGDIVPEPLLRFAHIDRFYLIIV